VKEEASSASDRKLGIQLLQTGLEEKRVMELLGEPSLRRAGTSNIVALYWIPTSDEFSETTGNLDATASGLVVILQDGLVVDWKTFEARGQSNMDSRNVGKGEL